MTAGWERSGNHWLNRFRNAQLGQALKKHGPKLVAIVMLAGSVALIAGSAGPVGKAVEIGPDEHYEVMKGFLWARGFPLYRQVWNDQPPLHTVLLGLCFKCFGAKIAVARTLTATFGFLLLAAFVTGVWRGGGAVAALIGSFCLLAAPEVFTMSVSTMLEIPALATALWALWPLLQWQRKQKWPWLMLSGGILAAALQIKLTAIIVAPALAVEIIFGLPKLTPLARVIAAVRIFGIWGAGVTAAYLGLVAAFGTVPLDVLWASHFSPRMLANAGNSLDASFLQVLFRKHADIMCSAGIGLLVLTLRQDWRRLAFPWIWLLTATLVHLNHRPWWPYYYLHFAVPLAWLTGYGIVDLFKVAWAGGPVGPMRRPFVPLASVLIALLLLFSVAWAGGQRLAATLTSIRRLGQVDDNAFVAKMSEFAGRTRFVYASSTIYAFHAKLLVIPELAVLPSKRFWSGQITQHQIFTIIQQYQPQQLLLRRPFSPEMKAWVDANYTLVHEEELYQLFVANSLVENGKQLGLKTALGPHPAGQDLRALDAGVRD